MRFGIAAALLAVIALALPALASADPLGSFTFFKSGLREAPKVTAMTAASDGNVWFVDSKAFAGVPAIGKVTPAGTITEYEQGVNLSGLNAESDLVSIATGPEGKLWFTDKGATPAIAVVDPTTCTSECTATEFSIKAEGGNEGAVPQDIVSGPGGNLWFTDAGTTPAIGKINPSTKAVEEFSIQAKGGNAGSRPQGIATGFDGNLWFTDTAGAASSIGRFNPSTEKVEEFATGENSLPGGTADENGPWGIAAGPDGNVWFTENGIETTKGRSAQGKAVGRITPSGTKEEIEASLTYFSTGLVASSLPFGGLTAAPDGKLWFTDLSGVSEKQELEINAAAGLGGTYKLGFGGQETGWSGTGNISGARGTGDVTRFPASGNVTCTRSTASFELTSCSSTTGAEVGMRIGATGIPAKTTITAVGATTITISAKPTANGAISNVNAGWIKNVSTTSGTFAVGQKLTSSAGGFAESEIIAVGASTIALSTSPTANATGASLEAGLKTISSVTTTTGCPVKGEEVSGAGIPAGTTISATVSGCSPTSLTISKFPTETATGVSLSANLPFDAGASVIQEALKKLPAIGETEGEANVGTEGTGGTAPVKRKIKFELELGAKNVEQLSCNGAGLSGISPTCSVTTTTQGVPNAIDSITTSGEITRYPSNELNWGLADVTQGADGNVWLGTGFFFIQKIGKLGIGEKYALKVNKTGTGSGTVTSSPAGINCGGDCEESYYEYQEVKLTATPDKGSEFKGWTGCDSETEGKCVVTTSSAKEVSAEFKAVGSNRRTLTLTKSAGGTGGTGSVKSKPAGINCSTGCTKAVGSFYETGPVPSSVTLTAKPASGSTFVEWTGDCSGAGLTCTVSMNEDHSVGAVFGTTSKAIAEPTALTVDKGESTGHGSVKASGLYCEADCTETTVLYQGTITLPKPKPAKTVELSQTPYFGSEFAGWTGCDKVEAGKCFVTMSSVKAVTAEYNAKPNVALTITKNTAEGNYTSGTGTVTSKPKGIKCGTTCITQTMAVPSGEAILLTAKAASGMTFTGWSGGGCSGTGTCTVSPEAATKVTASFSGAPKVIAEAQKLTLTKAGSAFGTVKASGIACEALCTSATSLYAGTVTLPKPKPAATVTLEAIPALGSKAVAWSGCDTETEGKCVVQMTTAKEVTATFDELE